MPPTLADLTVEPRRAADPPADGARHEAALVVNAHSRAGADAFALVRDRLIERGVHLVEAHAVKRPAHLAALVARLVQDGCPTVAVGGGDGTLRTAVGQLARRDAVLGVIPVGTANSFARALGVPLDPCAAADVVAAGRVARVDVGCINDRHFAATAAIGVASAVSAEMPPRLKRWLGFASYAVVGARKLFGYRPFRCTVRWDGGEATYAALDVLIANGAYQGGVMMADDARLDSGELVVRIIAGTRRWRLLRVLLSPRRAEPPEVPYVKCFRGRHFVIETHPPRRVNADGELIGRTPVTVSVVPGALRVLVPADPDGGKRQDAPGRTV